MFFSLVHHLTFVQGSSLEPIHLQVLWCSAWQVPLWNFKMIPSSKCNPVEQKLNVHLYRNLNSSCLVCEMLLSHY